MRNSCAASLESNTILLRQANSFVSHLSDMSAVKLLKKHDAFGMLRKIFNVDPAKQGGRLKFDVMTDKYERTRKSFSRYTDEVLPSHVKNLNTGDYEFVLWITPTLAEQQGLYAVITKAVDHLIAKQEWRLIVAPASFKRFQFANLETWPNY